MGGRKLVVRTAQLFDFQVHALEINVHLEGEREGGGGVFFQSKIKKIIKKKKKEKRGGGEAIDEAWGKQINK